jgi:hypothetical protein
MAIRICSRRVRTPSGTEWQVGRRWTSRGLPRWRSRAGTDSDLALEGVSIVDVGGFDGSPWALLASIVIGIVLVLILIPLLLFGIELMLAGLLVAGGIVARAALGRPWIVQAIPSGNPSGTLNWEVKGWRRSARLIEDVAAELSAGHTPSPGASAPVRASQ